MFNDITGGTVVFGDIIAASVYMLKSSFHRGRALSMRRTALHGLAMRAPDKRLKIDGETYFE